MIREMILPQLAMGMSEGTIAQWIVEEGEQIKRDDPLVSIETEKVTTEIPSPYAGFVHIVVEAGTTVPVEVLIAKIASSKEEYEQLVRSANEAVPASALSSDNAAKDSPVILQEPVANTGVRQENHRIKVSGLAKSIAKLEGLSLSDITGTGPYGRIVRRDVLAALEANKANIVSSISSVTGNADTAMREKARIPLVGMRGSLAKYMMQSKLTAAQTYGYFEVDVTNLLSARKTMLSREEELGIRISLIPIIAKALAITCQHIPICNATLTGNEITVWENVNIGIAVALPGKDEFSSGLIVPVIKNVERKNILQIAREIKELVKKALSGNLSQDEMSDHTITLSSTGGLAYPGAWGVSSPILNQPDVLAFQPGTPIKKPIVINDQIVVRDILPCGFTFDHRAVDGEPAGRFVKKITDLLTNPEMMLL